MFDDTFFVTGGGRSDPTETSTGTGAENPNSFKHVPTTTTTTTTTGLSSSGHRPRSTPMTLPSNQRKLTTKEGLSAGEAVKTTNRRDVWTADAGCLDHRRLCFRSQPIHDLVSATLQSIDPSGVFNMYQEWSNVKNRVLSRELFSRNFSFSASLCR